MSTDEIIPTKAKTVEIPTKHLGVGGVLVAAIMVLNPIKEWFFTREEAVAQGQRIERLEVSVLDLKDELTRRLERNSDKIIEQIRDSRAQTQRELDMQQKRIDALEAFRREWSKTKTSGG